MAGFDMKIALFHNLPAGGAKRALWEHARLLQARGHVLDAYVMSTATEEYLPLAPLCRRLSVHDAPAAPTDSLPDSLPWRVLGKNARKVVRAVRSLRSQIRHLNALETVYRDLARRIDAEGYDLVYVHHCRLLLSPALLRFLQTPSVYYCQDTMRHVHEWAVQEHPDYDLQKPRPGLVLERGYRVPGLTVRQWREADRRNTANARAATMVLANSFYSREAIVRTMGINARVCDLGTDGEFFRPDPAARRRREVLSVGAITSTKRHDFVLDAVAAIPLDRRPSMRIVGYEPARYGEAGMSPAAQALADRADACGVTLHFSKEVSNELVREAYQSAGVVAFAPYLEPFGFVPLEAMACGAATVGVREAGVRETIEDGVTGLLTERDVGAFSAALDRVLTDPVLAERLGAAGRRTVRERWTWERSVDRLEELFAQAAGRPPSPAERKAPCVSH